MPIVVLVEPDLTLVDVLHDALTGLAHLRSCCDFMTARHLLQESPPDLLVTNARLGTYSGLDLVQVAADFGGRTRCIVYTDGHDEVISREAVAAGAFFELQTRLPDALRAYVSQPLLLPKSDRRNLATADRRLVARGGRRAGDQPGKAQETNGVA